MMPRVYRWWMSLFSEKGEHKIDETDEATQFEEEAARGAKDVNRQHEERANISSSGREEPQQQQGGLGAQTQSRNDQGGERHQQPSEVRGEGEARTEEAAEEKASEGGGRRGEHHDDAGGESERGDESSNGDELSGDDGGDDDGDQHPSGQWNTQQAFSITGKAAASELASRFYRFIERIAEEETKVEDPSGRDKYSMKMLMLRRYTKRSLKACTISRVRERVVLILDNSGSMWWWMENILAIANVAMKRKDVEVYVAPNGVIEERIDGNGSATITYDEVDRLMKSWTGRTIVYVGDFDGANTPIRLSWKNRVIWFCPEKRYRRFRSHDWVDYDESEFKGVFVRCWDLAEFVDAMRRVTSARRAFIDYHSHEVFEDDNGDDGGS